MTKKSNSKFPIIFTNKNLRQSRFFGRRRFFAVLFPKSIINPANPQREYRFRDCPLPNRCRFRRKPKKSGCPRHHSPKKASYDIPFVPAELCRNNRTDMLFPAFGFALYFGHRCHRIVRLCMGSFGAFHALFCHFHSPQT